MIDTCGEKKSDLKMNVQFCTCYNALGHVNDPSKHEASGKQASPLSVPPSVYTGLGSPLSQSCISPLVDTLSSSFCATL